MLDEVRSSKSSRATTTHNSSLTSPPAYLTGFTGSAGCAVVTKDKAILSTDGRYFNQATKQLDSNWELLKQGMPDVLTWQEWSVATPIYLNR
jgi:Xaa-Pro aminopeptidase